MRQKVSDLNTSEEQWVESGIELAAKLVKAAGLDDEPGSRPDPESLDTAWAAWLSDHRRGEEDPNPFINAFGLALGAWLVDRLGLEWKLVEDEHGTEIAVRGREGDLLVFPPNLVAKRYVAGTTQFFGDVAQKIEAEVVTLRGSAGQARKPGLRNLFRH